MGRAFPLANPEGVTAVHNHAIGHGFFMLPFILLLLLRHERCLLLLLLVGRPLVLESGLSWRRLQASLVAGDVIACPLSAMAADANTSLISWGFLCGDSLAVGVV